jgi:hypothetical protein
MVVLNETKHLSRRFIMNDSIEIYEDTYPLTEEEYACLFEVPDDVEVE